MKDFNFAKKLAQRKEKAEAQAKKYFYDVKQRKAYYWAEVPDPHAGRGSHKTDFPERL